MSQFAASSAATAGRRPSSLLERRQVQDWNRRIHFYVGLCLLFFIWLFSISGLLLNHPEWEFARFWENREIFSSEVTITRPSAIEDLAIAQHLMTQLGVVGEINEIRRTADEDRFGLQVVRPGRIFSVDANFRTATATVEQIDLNAWGVLDALHKFTGVRMNDPTRQRDWVLTKLWSFAMDAVGLGLIVLVLSGLYLWYRLPKKRMPGLLALGLGTAACGFFLFGLAML
jgi:uncharacterized protein